METVKETFTQRWFEFDPGELTGTQRWSRCQLVSLTLVKRTGTHRLSRCQNNLAPSMSCPHVCYSNSSTFSFISLYWCIKVFITKNNRNKNIINLNNTVFIYKKICWHFFKIYFNVFKFINSILFHTNIYPLHILNKYCKN